jgi:hypothetical protein
MRQRMREIERAERHEVKPQSHKDTEL